MKSLISLLAIALVAMSARVSAEPAQNTKKAAKGKAKADPKADAKPAAEAPKKPAERTGPAKLEAKESGKIEDLEREALADKKRDESIDSLKKIIPKMGDGDAQKADLLFQLSELYWEKSRYLYRTEMQKLFNEQKQADEKKNRGEKVTEAKEDHRQSELFRSETMRLYETILREFPSYERKDEVLFNLASNQYELGKKEQAIKRYEELLKSYPGSKFVPDAYVQLGNHYFDVANVLEKARGYYEKAYVTTSPRIKSYALYKLAWCDFNAGDHEKALKKLEDTIDFAEKQEANKTEGAKGFKDLKSEALNDSIRMFVELNRADDAMAYFKAHAGKKKATTLTSRLADGLAGAGHHENAVKTYRFLLAENPISESAPDFQQAIIKSFEGLRQRDNVKVEVKRLAELYRPGSNWWKANESKKDVLRNGFNVAEEAMRNTVTEYHQEAQKTKQVETYRLARDIYKQYVDAFATNEDENFVSDQSFNLKYYYAEILWALEEWEAAAQQYDSVVSFKIPNREDAKQVSQEKYRQSAAFNSILAYDKLIKIERGQLAKSDLKNGDKVDEAKKKGGVDKTKGISKRSIKELAEKDLTKYEQSLVAACDKYNTMFPKNGDEIEVAYQAAVVFYDKNRFVEAARRFGEIINRFPEDKRSAEAADLSMAVLDEKEEWLELNKLARSFKSNTKLTAKNAEFNKRVATIVEGSQYKYVDEIVYKKEKDPKKAASAFLDFVKEFPTSENADRALTYAMIISREANELDKAIELGERLLKEYKNSVFDLKVKNSLAFFNEKMARFDRSAEMYENFIATYDLAAGDKAIGFENIKALLKAEKDAKDKEAKANKGKPASKTATGKDAPVALATVDMKSLKDDAKKKEREALIKEAEAWVADAQFNAGFWYEGVGKFDKAMAAYSRYVARFKDKKDVPDIAFNMALLLEKDGKLVDANKQYDAFLTTYAKDARVTDGRRLDVKYRQFLISQKLKSNDTDKLAKDITAGFAKLKDDEKKQDRAMLALAHVRFYALEPQWAAYLNMKFDYKNFTRAQIAQFAKVDRPKKEKALADLEKVYTEVLTIGNPEYGIAAVTRIGLAYSDFATNIGAIPDPGGFDQDRIDMFRGELENRYVFPVEEKAVEALERAIAKSSDLKLYNEWTLAAQDKLNKYKPNLYGKVRDMQYRGSEFFAVMGLDKTELPAEVSAEKPVEKKDTGAPVPSAAAPTPGAGSR